MSTTSRVSSDTSVTFSLAELAKIEHERVREEEQRRAIERDKLAREAESTDAARRAAEAAKTVVAEQARARRLRADAEEEARLLASERAAVEVARIEAQAKVKLEADNAVRAQELAVLRLRTESGRRHVSAALAGALALVMLGGTAFALNSSSQVATLEAEAARLRDSEQALAKEREHAKTTELTALERRYATLAARPLIHDAEDVRASVESARKAIDSRALDHDRLGAFADALDTLQARLEVLDRLAALDKRRDDLSTWATERKRTEVMAAARSAAVRAKLVADESSIRVYEASLDRLRDALSKDTPIAGNRSAPGKTETTNTRPCAGPGDPGCDLDGHRVF